MSGTRNINGLKTQVLTCIETAYDKGYKSGINDGNINDGTFAAKFKEAYDNGLNDAWECARKILDAVVPYDYWDIGSGNHISSVIRHYSADEAMQKIKEYEDRQKKTDDEIHVGDEFYLLNGTYKHTVIGFSNNGEILALRSDGTPVWCTCEEILKTGRKYPVVEILEGLKNDCNRLH